LKSKKAQETHMRATKIVATLGPATSSHERIRALALAGANVFRLNFSHGSHADHQARYQTVREVERELGTTLAILQDLQGPKIRLGVLPGGPRETRAGERLRFTADPAHSKTDAQLIPFPHADIIAELQMARCASACWA
jgi:pyruvate kinase